LKPTKPTLLAISLCGLLPALVLGCGKLDDKKIEASVQAELASKGVKLKVFDCPEGRPLQKGDKFDCSGVDQDGRALTFHVEQMDDAGNVNWKMEGVIIDEAKFGDRIEAEGGKAADVQCPSKVLIVKKGDVITCPVIINGEEHTIEITLTNDEGKVSWKTS
jgi:hypothetical protein